MTRDERRSAITAGILDQSSTGPAVWHPDMQHSFEYEPMPPKPPRRRGARTRGLFAATSTKMADIAPPPSAAPPPAKVSSLGHSSAWFAPGGHVLAPQHTSAVTFWTATA